jgi:iron(III) transport system substrate-binding protein
MSVSSLSKYWARWLLLLLPLLAGCQRSQPRVVLYCAQDEEFATLVFDDFRQKSGLTIAPHYDTESTKSVSLYEELLREARRPRCDVHWNNEILSTIRLQKQGLLEPYASPAAEAFPATARAPDDSWHAFAARARVLLVHTSLPAEKRPTSVLDLARTEWKGKVALAKPQFGTTATQAACLFEVLGRERAQEYYRGLRRNAHILAGNKNVAEAVSRDLPVGMTDTDDALAEIRARPGEVVIVFPDADRPAGDRMGTLFIPNTVAIIRGCPNREGARKLVDYLLSAEVEKRLAESPSGQIPLNPKVEAHLSPELRKPGSVKTMDVDFEKAAAMWDDVQEFLAEEFAHD